MSSIFIKNNNVNRQFLKVDGIHMNDIVVRTFAGNIVDFLNNFVLNRCENTNNRNENF